MPMPRIRPSHAAAAFMVLVLFVAPACESSFKDDGHISLDELEGRSSSSPTNAPTADSGVSGNSPSSDAASTGTAADIDNIRWLDTNISSWPVTTVLSAKISGGTIHMKYNKSKVWPVKDDVVANCWAIVNINGTWYAGTFEYLRPGQTSKPTGVLDGSKGNHFKKHPLSSWRPRSGERFGIMVSGLCRSSARNVSERSNIAIVTWP